MAEITKAHGKVAVTVVGGEVKMAFTPTEGVIGQIFDGATGLISSQTVNVGNGAIFERLISGGIGNGLAHFAHTGKVGLAFTPSMQFSFGG